VGGIAFEELRHSRDITSPVVALTIVDFPKKMARRTGRFPQLVDSRSSFVCGSTRFRRPARGHRDAAMNDFQLGVGRVT
jgi:hypothetical protein